MSRMTNRLLLKIDAKLQILRGFRRHGAGICHRGSALWRAILRVAEKMPDSAKTRFRHDTVGGGKKSGPAFGETASARGVLQPF
jgi:hypothetical protein